MRHAAYVHSTIAHGMVLSIDASEALALPGVEAVFTADDVPGFLFPTAGHPYSMDPSHGDVADRLLLTKHVRYYGDEVAVVVARDGLTARKAAHLVKVEYEPLPVMTSAETALAPGAPCSSLREPLTATAQAAHPRMQRHARRSPCDRRRGG